MHVSRVPVRRRSVDSEDSNAEDHYGNDYPEDGQYRRTCIFEKRVHFDVANPSSHLHRRFLKHTLTYRMTDSSLQKRLLTVATMLIKTTKEVKMNTTASLTEILIPKMFRIVVPTTVLEQPQTGLH